MARKPRSLTIDVAPLLDARWTGIPMFTVRLVQALRRDARLALHYAANGVMIPAAAVEAALRTECGVAVHEALASGTATLKPPPRDRPILYPSVKRDAGLVRREASTLHDLSTLYMPENHEEANIIHHTEHFEEELGTNEVVFCASEATRAALVTAYPSVAAKARVLHQYIEWPEPFELIERNLPRVRLGRYAIVVGTLEPRKNLALILKAVGTQEIEKSGIRFVVIGRKGWHMDRLLDEMSPAQRERVLFTGFVSEFTKYRLLRNAEFLVYPSLYEGFGIPALEAMSVGKPVLAARSSSFPEVIGDAGVYFDPLSVSEFAAAFHEIQHPKKLAELAPRALRQNAQFGAWRMAEPVVEWVGK